MATENKSKSVLTPSGRVSYPHVFEKAEYEDGGEGYEITLIFPKGTDLKALKQMVLDAIKTKWPDKDKRPKNLRMPFSPAGEKYGDLGFSNDDTYIKFKSNRKPAVVGPTKRNGKLVEIGPEDFLPGLLGPCLV